jgi:hypothetical protein
LALMVFASSALRASAAGNCSLKSFGISTAMMSLLGFLLNYGQ